MPLGRGYFNVVFCTGGGILVTATIGIHRNSKDIVEILQNKESKIKDTCIKDGNLTIVCGTPNTTTTKTILGETVTITEKGKTVEIQEFTLGFLEKKGATIQNTSLSSKNLKKNLSTQTN